MKLRKFLHMNKEFLTQIANLTFLLITDSIPANLGLLMSHLGNVNFKM